MLLSLPHVRDVPPLGEFEQMVLLAVSVRGKDGEAYGITVYDELTTRTKARGPRRGLHDARPAREKGPAVLVSDRADVRARRSGKALLSRDNLRAAPENRDAPSSTCGKGRRKSGM